ncbi:Speckle-type POZ protein B [Orchesella cincta]|uniref:Speckle-type POZ protein B n=1 Tax=Orchesella cincta TaxID=48709 RepID=A0A1D2M3R1_ORCCI|nr:Speckle-type POZ protein B [Orchesella cincta]
MSPETFTLLTANRVYSQAGFGLNQAYVKLIKDHFLADFEQLDFSTSENCKAAATTINKWVESTTKNKIKHLISEDSLNSLTRLVLVNGIYFKGLWEHQFNTFSTSKAQFRTSESNNVEVDMMYIQKTFPYAELPELDAKALGLKAMFSLPPADFSGIPERENPGLFVSTVIQKAFIEVNEEGAEAAAATIVVARRKCGHLSITIPFVVDRPFYFEIVDNANGELVLFSGHCNDPTNIDKGLLMKIQRHRGYDHHRDYTTATCLDPKTTNHFNLLLWKIWHNQLNELVGNVTQTVWTTWWHRSWRKRHSHLSGQLMNTQMQLVIRPKWKVGATESGEPEYLSVYLKMVEFGDDGVGNYDDFYDDERSIRADFQFNILDAHGKACSQTQAFNDEVGDPTDFYEFYNEGILGFDEFILSSVADQLVIDDKLKIHCKVMIIDETKHSIEEVSKRTPSFEEKYNSFRAQYSTDFGKIYRESIMTDVGVSSGASTYNAHKAVLAARSSVFEAMFSSDMKEKEMNTVTISDFEDDVVKGMLEHIYTGQAECMDERAPELLEIAEKYNLAGLKEDCEYAIAPKLNVENVAEILTLAHTHGAPHLKLSAINFIKRNKEELMKSKSFMDAVKADADSNMGAFAELKF